MKPVVENNLIGEQFFLTRQTANLMEDFAREINQGSALFLIYGVASVGKSRLLRELTDKGVQQRKFCWIDFKSNHFESETGNGSSDGITDSFVDEIKELMEVADERDVIIVDHFELASNKAKHQLFQSWMTDGIDKKINLIIASRTENFSDLRQLAQQYKVKIKSFQLMPCSMGEIEAFLGFYLFPASPLNALSIPTGIKKQLRSCNGVIGKVIEVAAQRGKQVSLQPDSDSESINYAPHIIATLLIILIAIGIGYQYWRPSAIDAETMPAQSDKTITIISDNDDLVSINRPESNQPNAMDEASQSTIDIQIATQQQAAPDIAELTIQSTASHGELESGKNAKIMKLQVESESTSVESAPARDDELEDLVIDNRSQPLNRLQHDLENTLEWIEAQDKDRATIQIMTVGVRNFHSGAYDRYLDNLVSKDIDVSGIRIYQTTINDSVVYGVLYGDYNSRREANKHIQQLPDTLKEEKPIPRTIGGIWNEVKNQLR